MGCLSNAWYKHQFSGREALSSIISALFCGQDTGIMKEDLAERGGENVIQRICALDSILTFFWQCFRRKILLGKAYNVLSVPGTTIGQWSAGKS